MVNVIAIVMSRQVTKLAQVIKYTTFKFLAIGIFTKTVTTERHSEFFFKPIGYILTGVKIQKVLG